MPPCSVALPLRADTDVINVFIIAIASIAQFIVAHRPLPIDHRDSAPQNIHSLIKTVHKIVQNLDVLRSTGRYRGPETMPRHAEEAAICWFNLTYGSMLVT